VFAHIGGSGSVGISGKGLDVVRRERRAVEAVKGDKTASDVEAYGAGSGSVNFQVDSFPW
jgi:hypothetical protein